jgi:hypothetical protein
MFTTWRPDNCRRIRKHPSMGTKSISGLTMVLSLSIIRRAAAAAQPIQRAVSNLTFVDS